METQKFVVVLHQSSSAPSQVKMKTVNENLPENNTKLIVPTTSNTSSWGVDFPEDIMKTILKKLVFADQARFLAVCKSWHLKHEVPPPVKQLPWLFTTQFHRHKKGYASWLYKLFDPIYEKTYDVRNHDLYINESWGSMYNQVWASMDGWLLMSVQLSRKTPHTLFSTFLFFYNLFTREQIKLPVLKSKLLLATCSYLPTSPNCTVFAITPFDFEVTSVHAWCPTKKTWSLSTVTLSLFSRDFKSMVYLRDTLWCYSFSEDLLLAIKLSGDTVQENTWSEVALPELSQSVKRIVIMEFKAELLLVCLGKTGMPCVFKLLSQSGTMTWVRLESIGNQTIFIAERYAISLEVSDQSISTLGGIEADGIYTALTPFLRFYSLKDDRRYTSTPYPPFNSHGTECVGYVEPPTLLSRRYSP